VDDRRALFGPGLDSLLGDVRDLPVTPQVTPDEIRAHLRARYDFAAPCAPENLLEDVTALLRRWSLHVTHPRYFGLFNPSALPITVVADALVAHYNPQVAAWHHGPVAHEMEQHVLRFLAARIGFAPDTTLAHFTSGGQEANHTAVIAALTQQFAAFGDNGLRALRGQPVFYISEESHHSFYKIAHGTGLGREAIRVVPVDDDLRMDVQAFDAAVAADRRAGLLPFLVVATAGSTSAGTIDPIPELGERARAHGLWLHVDAAWGGSALLSRQLRGHLAGIEAADSVTWDAHKWLSVPIGAGMFFCRHAEPVEKAFRVAASRYVPATVPGTRDHYTSSMQWSRRFIGLKLFMALAERGEAGYEQLIDHQTAMAEALRDKLQHQGWEIVTHCAPRSSTSTAAALLGSRK
jgi:glutamate/tyrosine decarboxylase-like PLP-dependent enzyme